MSEFSSRVYRRVFVAAATYNIAFGLWAALRPMAFFELFRLEPPRYPAIWACLGMVVGIYGLGYAYAARHLDRAYPFIAIGLAGKILGPIGMVMTIGSGELPLRTFLLIVFNDLIWWLPFGMFLLEGTPVAMLLRRTAPTWCAALHVVAGLGTMMLLRGGSEAVTDIQQRIGYLGEHPDRWRWGWLLWMLAAVSLLGFYAWWGSRVVTRVGLAAVSIAALGLVCDFAGEAIFIGWIPEPNTTLHRAASMLTGFAGNGLYTIAGIVLTVATPAIRGLMQVWTWLVWASGMALSLFAILNLAAGVVAASGALMLLFIPWVVVMGRKLR